MYSYTYRNHSTANRRATPSVGTFMAVRRMMMVTIPADGTDGTANVDNDVSILKYTHNYVQEQLQ